MFYSSSLNVIHRVVIVYLLNSLSIFILFSLKINQIIIILV